MPRIRPILALAAVACLWALPAAAQIGTATDIITGIVTDSLGRPVPDAIVEAYSLESQITRSARSSASGRYTILFPDGGGQYRMTARGIGLTPRQEMLYRRGEEDRLVWNPQLTSRPVALADITVRAGPNRTILPDMPTAGSTERNLTAEGLARLPLDATDLNMLATFAPGVVGLSATDSSAAAFSVAGLGTDANALTLDGLLFGSASLPQDGVRSTRVITSTYDVSKGQFSGGLVSATTRSGSNVVQGSTNYSLRDNSLAIEEGRTTFSQGYTQNTLSGGIGGPLLRDRLFAFVSGQARIRDDQQLTLLNAATGDLERLGVAPDSVSRFLTLVAGEGLSPTNHAGDGIRNNDNYSALARLDYILTGSHTMTLRGDWQGTGQDPARLGLTALPQAGGTSSSSSGGGLVSLTSRFGAQVINEVRAYLSGSHQDGNPFTRVPEGRVQVESDLADGTRSVSTLTFGGNTGLPTRSRASTFEATDEISILPGTGSHRLRLGGLYNQSSSLDILSRNQSGSFSFNALADFDNNLPASFRRTLAPTERRSSSVSWAFYAGDNWFATQALQLTYGLRYEGSAFRDEPQFNPVVDSIFGRRTDQLPSENHVSPRVGFNYMVGGQAGSPPVLTLRGGIGEFRSQIPGRLAAAAAASTGLASSESQIVCIGSDVPTPDWTLYRQDPDAIPTSCLGGGGPIPPASRNVTTFQDGFEAPRAWRASFGVQRTLSGLIRLSVDASYARGVSQTGYADLNLVAGPAFALSTERNRPVYVPSSQIVPLTGAVGFTGSRRDSTFGQVLETRSNLGSESEQLTVTLNGITRSGIIFTGSYTLSLARDQVSALGFGGGTTAGDPNTLEWATSSFDRRHAFMLTALIPIGKSLELTTITRFTSGTPYTPLVGTDINGDGFRNDRAFVFGPGADPTIVDGMDDQLAAASGRVGDCLLQQTGRIAGRNSCVGPWQASLDLQLNWRPTILGLSRRLSLSLVTVNFLGGLDELFHGSDNLHGWGQMARPDPTLLYVTGFDPTNQQFLYSVNGRFGATGGGTTAVRSPFQIGLQASFQIGPDRARQALDNFRGRGGPGGGPGGGDFISRIREAIPNSAAGVLELRDSLKLTPEQEASLKAVADSFEAKRDAFGQAMQEQVDKAGPNPDPARLMAAARPLFQEFMASVRSSIEATRQLLTPEQWAKVPNNLKGVFQRPGGGPGRPGPQ